LKSEIDMQIDARVNHFHFDSDLCLFVSLAPAPVCHPLTASSQPAHSLLPASTAIARAPSMLSGATLVSSSGKTCEMWGRSFPSSAHCRRVRMRSTTSTCPCRTASPARQPITLMPLICSRNTPINTCDIPVQPHRCRIGKHKYCSVCAHQHVVCAHGWPHPRGKANHKQPAAVGTAANRLIEHRTCDGIRILIRILSTFSDAATSERETFPAKCTVGWAHGTGAGGAPPTGSNTTSTPRPFGVSALTDCRNCGSVS
jgi:hypothetical protein